MEVKTFFIHFLWQMIFLQKKVKYYLISQSIIKLHILWRILWQMVFTSLFWLIAKN